MRKKVSEPAICPVCGEAVLHEKKVRAMQVWCLVCGVEKRLVGEYHKECFDRVICGKTCEGLFRYMLDGDKLGVIASGGVSRPREDVDSQKQRLGEIGGCNMVHIPKRGKAPFLRPKDVENGDLLTIVKEPSVQSEEESKYGRERTIVPVKIDRVGDVRRWGVNTTTNDRFVEAFGHDGSQWIGKRVKIRKMKQMVSGRERDVVYGIPQRQQEVAPGEKEAD